MNTYSFILCALLLMAPNAGAAAESSNNNFTMIDPGNNAFAGANDVHFSWDGTKKTSVAVSGQISNAKLSTKCPFFGVPWKAHDMAVYSAGTYTVYSDCPAGSPGCGKGIPIKFTVKDGEIGIHVLLDWNDTVDIDVVNVMKPKAVASPLWTEGCGSRSAYTVWNWMSYDFDGDGVNGRPVVDGPWVGMNVNFNLGSGTADLCYDAAKRCNDNNACTTDTCDAKKGVCVHAAVVCNDNNACTADSCDPAAGCVYTPIVCNDNNACTSDSCNPIKGCIYTPIVCNDNNACTADSCNPATGCVHTPVVCNDNNACTRDSCDPAKGCIYTPVTCPADQKCDPATGNCV